MHEEDELTVFKDCPWDNSPLEIISKWDKVVRVYDRDRGVVDIDETPMATARCFDQDHWFAGPIAVFMS